MSKRLSKKQEREVKKFVAKHWIVVVIVLLLVILALIAYKLGWLNFLFKTDENNNNDDDDIVLSTAGGYTTDVDAFGSLKVNFLQVGQADCILIILPDDKTMLIDSGDDTSDRKVISKCIEDNNITKIDYLLLTHTDADHVGNMDWVLNTYKVKYIFRPHVYSSNAIASDLPKEFNPVLDGKGVYVSTTKIYANFLVSAYNEEGCTSEFFNKDSDFTNTLKCGETKKTYSFDFLTPTAKREEIKYSDSNNYSPIVMLEYAGRKIMFNGDAELENIEEYVSTYGNANNVDVLKVGHHGSENATTQEFIEAIDPEYAVIQNGINRNYHHPHQATLDILKNHEGGVTLYRCDNNGNIVLSVTASGDMAWDMDNTDMSKNWFNGLQMEALDDESKTGKQSLNSVFDMYLSHALSLKKKYA